MLPVLLLLAGVATATPLNPFHTLFARQAAPSASPSDLGIPPACTAPCAPFLTIYNACNTGAVSECLQVCQPNNFSGFQACATCVLTSQGATPADIQQALIPVEQACAAVGAPVGGAGVGPTGALTTGAAGSAAGNTGAGAASTAVNGGVGTVASAGATAAASVGVVNPSAGAGAASTPVAGAVGSSSAHPSGSASASAKASPSAAAAAANSSANKLAPSAALVAVGIAAMLLQ